MDSSSPFDCLIFDLDDTLYSSKIGLAEALRKNIDDYLVEKCGFPESKASNLRYELFKTYGSSLVGLRVLGYDIDADDYHGFVHGRLPYDLIKPDSQLRNLVCNITQRKIIFTNSDRNHAVKVLDRLGLKDCFEQIICFETMNPNLSKSTRPDEFPVLLKPSMDAMKIALDVADVDPRRTLFLDDNVCNVAAGKDLGLRTKPSLYSETPGFVRLATLPWLGNSAIHWSTSAVGLHLTALYLMKLNAKESQQ
ncbi:hypothetical protein I3843_07G135000 [Carya illinoinensis]|uniref:Uncharacterized protein n=1 Tax=Carya illinoinensis TaxID=32201 RepID=A0A922EKK3_CARIL|nr:hypothetical protein I3842_07G139900 [Carya illinoinensis]KAG7971463.1 hypothetical protein I3843_07G135000 [Carya illinoinensis]